MIKIPAVWGFFQFKRLNLCFLIIKIYAAKNKPYPDQGLERSE